MPDSSKKSELPTIPSKRYFTIGEVSELCEVKPHVLRYWEQEFPTLKPVKRRGNRRYYQHHDVLLIRKIRALLYEEGYTIGGARQQLSGDKPGKENPRHPVQAPLTHAEIVQEIEAILELLDQSGPTPGSAALHHAP